MLDFDEELLPLKNKMAASTFFIKTAILSQKKEKLENKINQLDAVLSLISQSLNVFWRLMQQT